MSPSHQYGRSDEHSQLAAEFPENPFVERLVALAAGMGITFEPSPVLEQWLYHPDHRSIFVWEPDLHNESLTYLVVVLAHELGHAVDFDLHPHHREATRNLHWSEVPDEIEVAAFVQGFHILKKLWIPISLDQYEQMIEPSIAGLVRKKIETNYVCCLMSEPTSPAEVQSAAHPSRAAS